MAAPRLGISHHSFLSLLHFERVWVSMRRLASLSSLLLFSLFLLFAPEARADGLVIDSGYIDFQNRSGGFFSLSGGGMTLNGGIDFAPFVCAPCTAGETASISFYRVGGDIRGGSGVVNGVVYDRLFYEANMRIEGDVFFVPDDTSSIVTLTVPFTFSGSVLGCEQSTTGSPCASPIFSTTLSGQGWATVQLHSYVFNTGLRVYDLQRITYNFGPGAPVPEPATLLLLGTGLAGVAARFRMKRRRSKAED